MSETIILYPEYIAKEILVPIILEFGEKADLELTRYTENITNHEEDVVLTREVKENFYHHILFDLFTKEQFDKYKSHFYVFNDKKYFSLMHIDHDRDIMDKVGEFVLLLAKHYPDIVMTRDSYTDFYTMERIAKEGMPWVIPPESWDIY